MIKLLGFLFTFVSIYAQESVFNLPDHHSRFLSQLDHSLKVSSKILISTPSLHHSALKKELVSAIKRESTLKLMVQDPIGDPLSLIQYKNIELYLSALPKKQSIILIDESLVCSADVAIDEELFSSRHSVIRCSDNPQKIRAIRSELYHVMQHSKSYLE